MDPRISLFPNVQFYGRKILDGPNVMSSVYNKDYTNLPFGTYAFINISDGREEKEGTGNSWRNLVEVAVVLHLIQTIFKSIFLFLIMVFLMSIWNYLDNITLYLYFLLTWDIALQIRVFFAYVVQLAQNFFSTWSFSIYCIVEKYNFTDLLAVSCNNLWFWYPMLSVRCKLL